MSTPRRQRQQIRVVNSTGPDAREYQITDEQDALVAAFRTGGVAGKTNHETAEANLADVSTYNSGTFLLFCEGLLMATSVGGTINSLRPDRPGQLRAEAA